MLTAPPELGKRYRRFLNGRGDVIAPLVSFLGSDDGARARDRAWAALVLSRISLNRDRVNLARSYLRLSVKIFGNLPGECIPPAVWLQRALILEAEDKRPEAVDLLRRVFALSVRSGRTLDAADVAHHLSLLLSRAGEADEALSFLACAQRCIDVCDTAEMTVRVDLSRAVIEFRQGLIEEAVDRIALMLEKCRNHGYRWEYIEGSLLLAEIFIRSADVTKAEHFLYQVSLLQSDLKIFRPLGAKLRYLRTQLAAKSGRSELSSEAVTGAVTSEAVTGAITLRDGPGPAVEYKASIGASSNFLTSSETLLHLMEEIRDAASLPLPILLEGESGVGKDLVARLVHRWSGRGGKPLLSINASALPRELFESSLFGFRRGAFTGAVTGSSGLLEEAGNGTVLLDEIGDLDVSLQAKLLRFLESGEYIRLGETKVRKSCVRVIAATNHDLHRRIDSGQFRRDLYHRLSVLSYRLPPLRERRDDIRPLAEHFLEEAFHRYGIGPLELGKGALLLLGMYHWPGNVRELRNEILRAALKKKRGILRAYHFSAGMMDCFWGNNASSGNSLSGKMRDLERREIIKALNGCGGNRTKAATRLGLKRTTLIYKMKRFGLE